MGTAGKLLVEEGAAAGGSSEGGLGRLPAGTAFRSPDAGELGAARPRTRRGVLMAVAGAGLPAWLAFAATACGGGAAPAGPAQPGGALKGTVRMLGWDQEPISGSRRRAMDGLRAKFPQLDLQQDTTGAAGQVYFDKLQALIASDSAPDMFIIPDSSLPFFLTRKLAMNLDPLVKRDKYDLSDFPKGAIEAYRYKGGLYGLPDNITSIGFFVNEDLFKQAGVTPPPTQEDKSWTFDKFLQTCQQLVARVKTDPPTFAIAPSLGTIGLLAWLRSNGGDLLNADRSATALESTGALEVLQLLSDLRNKTKVAPSAADLAASNALALFEGGRLAIMENCVCQVGRERKSAPFNWDAGFRPAGKAGLIDHLYAFPQLLYAASKNPDGAWAALKWFEDEGMKLLVQDGSLQGTKMNAHQRAIFVDPKQKPAHAELWVTSVEKYGRTPPATTNWNDVDTALTKELTPLWNGDRTARDAVQAIKQTVDPLIQQGRWD